jgi:hypothetical protein
MEFKFQFHRHAEMSHHVGGQAECCGRSTENVVTLLLHHVTCPQLLWLQLRASVSACRNEVELNCS